MRRSSTGKLPWKDIQGAKRFDQCRRLLVDAEANSLERKTDGATLVLHSRNRDRPVTEKMT